MNSTHGNSKKEELYSYEEKEELARLHKEYVECKAEYDRICDEIREMGKLLEIPIQQYSGMRIDTVLALLEKVVR
jgi:hypothetical protein